MYTDKYNHWQASKELAQTDATYGATSHCSRPGVAFIVWHSTSSSLEIPIQLRKAMVSLARNGGFINVFLISYQRLTNVPTGVSLVYACRYIDDERFQTVLN